MLMMQRLNGFSATAWFSEVTAAGLWKLVLPIVYCSPEEAYGQQSPPQSGTFHDGCILAGSLLALALPLNDTFGLFNS